MRTSTFIANSRRAHTHLNVSISMIMGGGICSFALYCSGIGGIFFLDFPRVQPSAKSLVSICACWPGVFSPLLWPVIRYAFFGHMIGNSSLGGMRSSGVYSCHPFHFLLVSFCAHIITLPRFIYHVTAERPKVIKDKPDLTFGEVGKELGSRWRALGDKEKETWKNKPE